jgi:hypothetical protein
MAKKKEMNRTSGTAKRKAPNTMSASERIGRQRQAESANPGPRDRFNPAAAQGVVDTFGVGVNSSGKFEFNPIATLGMALPVGKIAKAAKALRAVGGARNRSVAAGLTERLRSKAAGKSFGQSLAENKAAGGGPILQYLVGAGTASRRASEKVFPRAPKKGFLGDLEAGALPGSNMTNVQARRLAASRAADRAGNYTPVRELEKRLKLPKGRGR